MSIFHSLEDFGATRKTLHAIAKLFGEMSKKYGISQPNWRHMSLKVQPGGLTTDSIPMTSGTVVAFRLDLLGHKIVAAKSDGGSHEISLIDDLKRVEEELIRLTAELDVPIETAPPGPTAAHAGYDPDIAAAFYQTLIQVDRIFKQHLATLSGPVSPVLLWPHGFDLSCEWYGSRMVEWEKDGVKSKIPSQLNLGFYPGNNNDESYFYSNPWPFDEARLLDKPLPVGARWHRDGWKGAMLPYSELLNSPDPESRLQHFAEAVYEIAALTLN